MIRKLVVLTVLVSLAGATAASAQRRTVRPAQAQPNWQPRKEISVFAGYMFWGSMDAVLGSTPGRLRIKDAPSYGVTFGLPVRPGVMAEFYYLRQPTELSFTPAGTGIRDKLFDMHVAYYQVGGLYEAIRGRARPFGALRLGVTHFNPKDARYGSEWRFSFSLGLGARVFLTENIGIRGQADLLVPVNFYGAGMWCGVGGCSVGGTATAIAQGSLTGGLVVAF
jgi:opacity protein-like surface antigen